jgi:hypothetical protein
MWKFLMDENLAFKNEGKLSLEEAATVGVGALVSSFEKRERLSC